MAKLVIEQQDFTVETDAFYSEIHQAINAASPPAHMSADYLNDPLGCGLLMYAPRVYKRIEELKCRESQ